MFVGDSLDTDMRTAMENGVDSALVLTGTADLERVRRSALVPSFIFDSIAHLHQALESSHLQSKQASDA
jgi:ribonucleotide monophosphatase NagD (HAD superfamily)